MNKRELAILEKAFDMEVSAALQGGSRLMQSRSKVAAQLAADGYLEKRIEKFGAGAFTVTCEGYELTHAGRFAYCSTCDAEPDFQRARKVLNWGTR
jgi:hypothetical protein